MNSRRLIGIVILATAAVVGGCGDNQTHPPDLDPYQSGELAPLECLPNLDGQIDSGELGVAFDVPVSYRVSPAGEERPVDLVGALDPQGHQVWDWGADYQSDQLAKLSAMEVPGQWYAGSFPGASFASFFDAGGRVHAVYSIDDQGLRLLGLASAQEHPAEGKTLLPYQSPVELYRFPLTPGQNWVSVGEVQNGTFRDLPYAGRDTYEIEVDGAGQLVLPEITFTQALRIRTRTVVQPAVGQSTSQRQVSFLFECFGEVARATSRTDETVEDFTTALEVRRLGL
jgi:hypothetical protein